MAITFDTNAGFFATEIASLGKKLNDADAASYIDAAEMEQIYQGLYKAAQIKVTKTVDADTELPELTIKAAWDQVIIQMLAQSETVDASSVGTGSVSNPAVGTGSRILNVNNPQRSFEAGTTVAYQHARPETITMECISDQQGTGLSGREQFRVYGESALLPHHKDWPGGSGVNTIIRATCALDNGYAHLPGHTMLVNGSFENYGVTANVPDGWTVQTGTAGTHFGEVSTPHLGSKAFKFIGDASTLAKIRQQMGVPTGSIVYLQPFTVYGMSFAVRRASGAITGVIRVSLQDSGGTIAGLGNSASMSYDVSAASATYAVQTGSFMTGQTVPSTLYAAVEQTTALGNTHEVYIDDFMVFPLYKLTPHGPSVGIVPGATPFVVQDKFVFTVSNDFAGAISHLCDRLFAFHENGIQLPSVSDGSETVADSFAVTCP